MTLMSFSWSDASAKSDDEHNIQRTVVTEKPARRSVQFEDREQNSKTSGPKSAASG